MNTSTVEITALPAFRDNYIWLLRAGDRAVVVDPGDAAPVLDHLAAQGLTLAAILLTHHHNDHSGGLADLLARAPAVPAGVAVFGPAAESITGVSHPLAGGEALLAADLGLTLPGLQGLSVWPVSGHTRGHLAYHLPAAWLGREVLFCGDTLFGAGCGRLFEGTPAQMVESLMRIAALPDDTAIYCAHEYTAMNLPFAAAVEPDNAAIAARQERVTSRRAAGLATVPLALGEEKATNPFLRWAEPAVIAAARARGAESDAPVAVFAAIRAWRNEF
jgi:hydroxyacylglutathione hydrolase